MKITHQQHLTNWFKIPVVAVYVLFFSVQLFFNLDIASCTNNAISGFSIFSTSTSIKADSKPIIKVDVRLNKRFEPSIITINNPFCIEIPQYFLEIKKGFVYSEPFISAYKISAHTLRGPPNVA